jgi:hypothetical protein
MCELFIIKFKVYFVLRPTVIDIDFFNEYASVYVKSAKYIKNRGVIDSIDIGVSTIFVIRFDIDSVF